MKYIEFIKLKKEELSYIKQVHKLSLKKKFTEDEKLEVFRKLDDYATNLRNLYNNYWRESDDEVIIEFDISKEYLSDLDEDDIIAIFNYLHIDIDNSRVIETIDTAMNHKSINVGSILNNQSFKPIYVEGGIYDPYDTGDDSRLVYMYALGGYAAERIIDASEKESFESDKIIIRRRPYVYRGYIPAILREEMLNKDNITMDDCIKATEKRIDELSYANSPEGKQQLLLDKVNNLYKKVKGEFINEEVLYNGKFLDVIRETYKLPNERTVQKEKVVKNNSKNAVVIVAITEDEKHNNKYIITVQNRIRNRVIAEFPGGYIEENEDVLTAAKRELKEETGYTSNNMFILEESYTSPGTDNSITYIVVASNCIKTDEKSTDGTELVDYDLFTEDELKRLIDNNIMSGGISKLAYYSLKDNGSVYINKKKN